MLSDHELILHLERRKRRRFVRLSRYGVEIWSTLQVHAFGHGMMTQQIHRLPLPRSRWSRDKRMSDEDLVQYGVCLQPLDLKGKTGR